MLALKIFACLVAVLVCTLVLFASGKRLGRRAQRLRPSDYWKWRHGYHGEEQVRNGLCNLGSLLIAVVMLLLVAMVAAAAVQGQFILGGFAVALVTFAIGFATAWFTVPPDQDGVRYC